MRSQLRYVVQDEEGNVRSGQAVALFTYGTTTPIPNALYATPTSMVVLSPSALTTDSLGEIELWIDGLSAPVAIRVGGVSGVTETAYFTPDPATLPGLDQSGPRIFDVEAYGAVGDGATDDTAAIQACIDAVKAVIAAHQYIGATVRFNSPLYAVSALDCTGMSNVLFLGLSGFGGTLIYGNTQTTGVHAAGGKAVFDGTGTAACVWQGIVVDTSQVSASNVVPMAGWLLSADGAGNNGTADRLINCGTQGPFQVAALITLYATDHVFIACAFQQYQIDRPVILMGSANPGNVGTVTSLTANTFPPSSGGAGGDLSFFGCEAHHMPASGGFSAPYNTGQGYVLDIQAALAVRWYGGNLASYGTGVVRLGGANTGLLISGAQCYSDDGGFQAKYLIDVVNSSSINGLTLTGLDLNSILANASTSALLRIGVESSASNVVVQGVGGSYPAAACAVLAGGFASAATVAITDADIECDGHPVNLNGSSHGPSLAGSVVFRNPGTMSRDISAVTPCVILSEGHLGLAASNLPFPATTGALGLPTQTAITWRGGADAVDLQGITSTNTDRLQIGATTNVVGTILNGTTDHDFQVAGTTKTKVTSAGLKPTRLVGDGVATALATGNFASLHADWGTGASCTAVSRHEVAGRFTITAGSASTGSSPTLVFTYPGGAYATAPEVFCTFVGGTGAGTIHQVGTTPGTTTCTLQMFFTPTVNLTYTYAILVIG